MTVGFRPLLHCVKLAMFCYEPYSILTMVSDSNAKLISLSVRQSTRTCPIVTLKQIVMTPTWSKKFLLKLMTICIERLPSVRRHFS